jgi:hypothetical protein
MPYSQWKLIFESEKKESAQKVMNQCLKLIPRPAMDISLSPYHKGGYEGNFYFYHDEKNEWSQSVLEVIDFGQRIGGSWVLTGTILDSPSGVLSKEIPHTRIKAAGLIWASWQLTQEMNT